MNPNTKAQDAAPPAPKKLYTGAVYTVLSTSVVDRHHVNADPELDPTFYFLMPIQIRIRILPPSFTRVPKSDFFYFSSQQCQFILFCLSRQRNRCHNFLFFGRYIEIFWKKYSLTLDLVEMDKDPDPPKRSRSDRVRIHNTRSIINTIPTFRQLVRSYLTWFVSNHRPA